MNLLIDKKYIVVALISLFFLSCVDEKNQNEEEGVSLSQSGTKIASIRNASGISFCKESKTVIVASDKGKFYEINRYGDTLASYNIGDYDFEGVVCEERELIFAIEGEGLLRFNRESEESRFYALENIDFELSKKHGIEGIAKVGEFYYLAIQAKKKKSAKLLKVILDDSTAAVVDVVKDKIVDSSGLEFHKGKLYIVSDDKDRLYSYDLEDEEIISSIEIPKFAQEGITFGEGNDIFFADDDGSVFLYEIYGVK